MPTGDTLLDEAAAQFEGSRWEEACGRYAAADRVSALAPRDLERYAEAAQLSGRTDDALSCLARLFEGYEAAGDLHGVARTGYWLWSAHALARGEFALGAGWIARARSLAGASGLEPDGWLLVPEAYGHIGAGELEVAAGLLLRAAERGVATGDVDLVTMANVMRGRCLLKAGSTAPGLQVLDEAMVRVIRHRTSPRATSVLFCAAIGTCHEEQELERACEWSVALDEWLSSLPGLSGVYLGNCRVYRAVLMRLRGDWTRASAELEQACRDLAVDGQLVAGHAWYELGEMRRLRGEPGVMEAYQEATRLGRSVHPGLGLLQLGDGQVDAARLGLRRALAEREQSLARFELLPALVRATLLAGDLDAARALLAEMEEVRTQHPTPAVKAQVAEAAGHLALATDRAEEALGCLRRGMEEWRALSAPYEVARLGVLVAEACRAVADHAGARLELEATLATFERLGARPDHDRAAVLLGAAGDGSPGRDGGPGLTPREVEVLRLVAVGHTNAAIATELLISERTVHRHVSNILAKLDVGSRTAAAAYAVHHGLG